MLKTLATLGLLAGTALTAQAHSGHGLPGIAHWHAGDALLWVIGVGVAAAVYVGNRRR